MYTLKGVMQSIQTTKEINGKWVPARPINHQYRTLRERLSDAWAVFTGRADAFIWPEGQ